LRARHVSICAHHAFSAFFELAATGLPERRISSSTMADIAHDRHIDMDVLVDRDGSISIWIFFEPGENLVSGR
jgi:hypothetical protein